MKFEDYIVGVLAGEMSNDFPAEALAAQAILQELLSWNLSEKVNSKYEGGTYFHGYRRRHRLGMLRKLMTEL